MTENVGKLVGVVVVAVLVVVGVVATSGGGDVDFTRNAAFLRMPKAQQARLAPAFVERAAPKAIDTGRAEKIGWILLTPKPDVTDSTGEAKTNKAQGQIKAGIVLQSGGTDALGTGKASVLAGKGVDGKGGTSSFRAGGAMDGKTGKAGIGSTGGVHGLSGRKASFRAGNGVNGVADRIAECASSFEEIKVTVTGAGTGTVANSLKNVLVSSYLGDKKGESYNCQDLQGKDLLPDDTSFPAVVNPDSMKPLLLAACMESKVGDVFLKSHIESSAADCIATVLPALSPDRAKQLGTYWQTQQQLANVDLQN
ncbi:MAG: hypothetical protein VYB10_04130 [Actinomycetota bacterium]|nr:hypothetical protein [Actinomycetota bacterium]